MEYYHRDTFEMQEAIVFFLPSFFQFRKAICYNMFCLTVCVQCILVLYYVRGGNTVYSIVGHFIQFLFYFRCWAGYLKGGKCCLQSCNETYIEIEGPFFQILRKHFYCVKVGTQT